MYDSSQMLCNSTMGPSDGVCARVPVCLCACVYTRTALTCTPTQTNTRARPTGSSPGPNGTHSEEVCPGANAIVPCPQGYYCPTPVEWHRCPKSYYCPKGGLRAVSKAKFHYSCACKSRDSMLTFLFGPNILVLPKSTHLLFCTSNIKAAKSIGPCLVDRLPTYRFKPLLTPNPRMATSEMSNGKLSMQQGGPTSA